MNEPCMTINGRDDELRRETEKIASAKRNFSFKVLIPVSLRTIYCVEISNGNRQVRKRVQKAGFLEFSSPL